MDERLGGVLLTLALIILGSSLLLAAPAAAAPSDPTLDSPAGMTEEAGAQEIEPDPLFDFDQDLELEGDGSERDPIEPINRVFFAANEAIDWAIWNPLTRGYQIAVPEPARRGVFRVFRNLNSPSIIVNKLLQLQFKGAAKALGRFVLNTTIGWGGLFDAGKAAGWEYEHADFGQTLALAGVPSGAYLVLPLLGPTTVRDGVGDAVDQFLHPMTYFLGPLPVGTSRWSTQLFVGTGMGLSTREAHAEELRALRESSVDFYSVLRSVYLQNREAEIHGAGL
jgi:phospholipid-binding lipoprotein MlaA